MTLIALGSLYVAITTYRFNRQQNENDFVSHSLDTVVDEYYATLLCIESTACPSHSKSNTSGPTCVHFMFQQIHPSYSRFKNTSIIGWYINPPMNVYDRFTKIKYEKLPEASLWQRPRVAGVVARLRVPQIEKCVH